MFNLVLLYSIGLENDRHPYGQQHSETDTWKQKVLYISHAQCGAQTPKLIQTYMPLFSPFIQGEFKFWLLNITMCI